MDLPSRRLLRHNTRAPTLNFPQTASLSDQNAPPAYKISDKCSQAIQKSFAILDKQLNQNRRYLTQFEGKLEKIYQIQQLRGVLKEREYRNLVKEFQKKKEIFDQEVDRIKEYNQKDYKEIIEENERLEGLKRSYEEILRKQEAQYSNESKRMKELTQKNNQTKQKIKILWKTLAAEHHNLKSAPETTKDSSQVKKLKRVLQKTINQSINATISTQKSSIIEQQDSLYVTRNVILDPPKTQPQKFPIELPKLFQNPNSSLTKYEQAIEKIESLEMSIIASKRTKNKSQIDSVSASEQEMRRQKIRERIEEVQYTVQMLKLFIVYLKSNDNTENRTGITNLRKVICYFEKLQKTKEDALHNIRQMNKNLHF